MKNSYIKTRADWKSADLYKSRDWIYELSKEDLKELDYAISVNRKFEEGDFNALVKQDFPLNRLKNKLEEISDFLENGKGIFLLRGMPVEKYSHDEMRKIFYYVGLYLGTPVRQSLKGELIYDVMDKGKSLTDKKGRGTATSDPLPFHTDRSDIVALLCLQNVCEGGQSRVVSGVAIHNEILRVRPDLLEVLYQPYYHARTAWESETENDFYPLPIFSMFEGKFALRYLRHFVNLAQEFPLVPKMSNAQVEALNLVESLANDPTFCADMDFRPGDIQLLNNFVSLHSRAGYQDPKDDILKRHLLRLWLSMPNSRPLSPSFAPLY